MYRIYTKKVYWPDRCIPKILLIMKLTTVLLIGTFLHLSAAGIAQNITFSKRNVTLRDVFTQIRRQSGFNIIVIGQKVNLSTTIDVNFNNTPVEESIKSTLSGLPLSYKIDNKIIVIQEQEKSLLDNVVSYFKAIDVRGRVLDSEGKPLVGATVTIKGSTKRPVITGDDGNFFIAGVDENAVLIISYLGYRPREVLALKDFGEIKLESTAGELHEVGIVSTGYQDIPKERATGSFVLIDSALLSRKVSTNILDRLDGVTSGLIFNKTRVGGTPAISIRGRSTIASNTDPLIILDNFPYDGDISNINPQDVKSISILKDGAAASIWGSRAGNGVIVITTYKGSFNQKPTISLNTNLTIGDKPDVYYRDQLTNQEFIGVEQFLFDKGAYNTIINNGYGSLSPAVEIMLQRRNGTIATDQARDAALSALAAHDNRDDFDKYYYRKSVNQQYQLNVNGGGQNNKYYISMGYDKNLANTVINSNDRLTLNANNTLSLLNDKIELYSGILFSSSKSSQNGIVYQPRYPYEKIADINGNPLVVTDGTLRIPYIDTIGRGRLLDWRYQPLDEIQDDANVSLSKLTDYRFNLGINYKIIPNLKFSVNYSYDKGFTESSNYNAASSYYTRNLINSFSQISPTGIVTNPLPMGDILANSTNSYHSHYGRGQFGYDKVFGEKHQVSAIAGFEVKDFQSSFGSSRLYGYNMDTESNLNSSINPTVNYPYIYGFNTARIPLGISNLGSIDRYRSYYFNGSYIFDKKYIFSTSARKDESNLFGVKSNQKGVPLWSAGFSWNLSNEDFYKSSAIPDVKLRITYGYNGNVNKSVSAYLTALSVNLINTWGQRYISVQNPPNPSLSWEKVKNIDFGIDFASKNHRISGSLDYWIKDGIDLIGTSPIAPQTGIATFTGNSSNMRGQGIDLVLNSKNINKKYFSWFSSLLFNYNTDKITSYKVKASNNVNIVTSNYSQPLEGYSFYSLFSFPWKGLDAQGDPQSVLNGTTSKDYANISNSYNPNDLIYSGTITPKIHGSLLNTFSWKSIELSFNLLYRFNYVYRRSSLSNSSLYLNPNGLASYQQSDYELRWQKPGDETNTSVPALIYPSNSLREVVYSGSSILVERGDHIRLQDIKINYNLSKGKSKNIFFSNLNVYAYAANLGIIWKASKYRIDPDNPTGVPLPKVLSIGFKADF
jgi:TonB-linked SusC/RagA family outer membrane protein